MNVWEEEIEELNNSEGCLDSHRYDASPPHSSSPFKLISPVFVNRECDRLCNWASLFL